MRHRMTVVLVAVAVAACHPRYVPLEERGVGGSAGLDSIRARVLACIAARNYDQAREYLKLAANMTEEEQAQFEQMISAAERGLVPFLERALPHIFRAKPGHFPVDTAAARELIQTTVMETNLSAFPWTETESTLGSWRPDPRSGSSFGTGPLEMVDATTSQGPWRPCSNNQGE